MLTITHTICLLMKMLTPLHPHLGYWDIPPYSMKKNPLEKEHPNERNSYYVQRE